MSALQFPLGTGAAPVPAIAQPCAGYSSPSILCIHNYGAVLPEGFERIIQPVVGATDTYASTSVPEDPSFSLLSNASFLIFDEARAPDILGPDPVVDFIFPLDNVPHEAPTYEPNLNLIFFSRLRPDPPAQYVIDLNTEPPTLEQRIFDPPLVVPCGSTYHAGLIYWCGSATYNGIYTPGIYALNGSTGRIHPVLNNYFGYNFGTCDDLAVAPNGDIWFTDNWYIHGLPHINHNHTIHLETAVYRFTPSTGHVQIVSDDFSQPNGIAFSADHKTVYVTDTGADTVSLSTGEISYHSNGKRTVYAADLLPDGTGMMNKRAIFLAQDRVPDGIKTARNGYVATATGHGVDVLDERGVLVVRVQTNFTVLNIVWAGEGLRELWMVGFGGVGRVRWGLEGRELV
ncbi:lactonohydrolase [Aspergillus sclerotiicarbonarius CBS 121057]|uniref:Lactonohydrolase n=1 Tax=Aspergillus sclerotiicarbonarius (strain CBS 121057 / IBT 28362) TaxID=1448318 RepID=A0A319DS60_ASPSB|nr:lactonohydrolase [Aspergillus sclerotiicarbonarius CBS 121057]